MIRFVLTLLISCEVQLFHTDIYTIYVHKTLIISMIQLQFIQDGHALMSNILSTMRGNLKYDKLGNIGTSTAS
jgi:hypothetical protein